MKKKPFVLIVMFALSLCIGIMGHGILQGRHEIFLPFLFSCSGLCILFYWWYNQQEKVTIRSTDEIIDDCWAEHEREKAAGPQKNVPRDQKPGS